MASKYLKWCPDGCGKSVYIDYSRYKAVYTFLCTRCKNTFTPKRMDEIN